MHAQLRMLHLSNFLEHIRHVADNSYLLVSVSRHGTLDIALDALKAGCLRETCHALNASSLRETCHD